MYDYINRFVGSEKPELLATFDPILGGPNWKERLDQSLPRGQAVEKLFREELKKAGNFKYVLSTQIEKTTSDRPHFAIAYGTRSPDGLKAFRQVEYDALRDHGKRRAEAKLERVEARTGQGNLFSAEELPESNQVEELVRLTRVEATTWVQSFLQSRSRPIQFSELCSCALERFMLRETDVKDICVAIAESGFITAPWRQDGKQKPHGHHLLTWAGKK